MMIAPLRAGQPHLARHHRLLYSNFSEVDRINSVTFRSVIKEMKAVFARYVIPDVIVTDNGPQHITSSPHHPQSNGKAENAVKTMKRLFTKCRESDQSEFLALLDWRNTPTEVVGTSNARCLVGRRCKTLIPVANILS